MKRQRMMVLLAFPLLLAVAAVIGCGTLGVDGFLIPVGSQSQVKFAFVVNGNPESDRNSVTVSAYTVNSSTGALTAAPGSPFGTDVSGCCGTVFIDADPTSRFVYVPNGGGGGGEKPEQQQPSPDTVSVFSVDQSTGALTEVSGSPFSSGGSDPFSAKADPSGRFVFVANRGDDTVAAFSVGSNGTLTPAGTVQSITAEPYQMMTDPQSRFLYVTAGGGATIWGFSINSSSGALTPIPGSPFFVPCESRSGTVDFAGHFLVVAVRSCDEVAVYTIDQTTGALSQVNGSPFPTGDRPFHVVEVANGDQTFVAVNNLDDANISVFTFNTSTGALAAVSGSPFTFNNFQWPHYMAADTAGQFGYIVDFSNTITGVTISANGTVTQITGSPFTTGGLSTPTQIVLSH